MNMSRLVALGYRPSVDWRDGFRRMVEALAPGEPTGETGKDAANALKDRDIDVVFMIASPAAQPVMELLMALEPIASCSAATLPAWHSRVQWSTLLVPITPRMNFCSR